MPEYVIRGRDGRFWDGAEWVAAYQNADVHTKWTSAVDRAARQASTDQPCKIIKDLGTSFEQSVGSY